MPTHNPKRVAERLQKITDAWETLRPSKSFAGMTLEQFKAKVQPSLHVRVQLGTLRTQLKGIRAQRHDSDNTSMDLVQLVVNAVKGDPEEGETSGLYAAMGFVPKNERRSGLTRMGQATPPTGTTTANN